MKITYKDYVITVEPDQIILSRLQKIEKGKHAGEMNEVNYGYFTRMESVIDKIIRITIAEDDSRVDLKEFITQYRNIANEVLNAIK